MRTVPAQVIFGQYSFANGSQPIAADPQTADRLTALVAAGVPYSQPPVIWLWKCESLDARFVPMDIEPGQIGWEVTARAIVLDHTRDGDGALATPPVLEVALFEDDGLTPACYHSVELPVPELSPDYEGTVSIQANPEIALPTSAGSAQLTDGSARSGLLWTTPARSLRHKLLVVAAENVGLAWLRLVPVWDHSTPIADMDP